MAQALASPQFGDNSPFCNRWWLLPVPMRQTLIGYDVLPYKHNIPLFVEMTKTYGSYIVKESLALLPESLQNDETLANYNENLKSFFAFCVLQPGEEEDPHKQTYIHDILAVRLMEKQCATEHDEEDQSEVRNALLKWRHWKPQCQPNMPILLQRTLEIGLKQKWLARLVSVLAPYASEIPAFRKFLHSPQRQQEWQDLCGKTRYSTLRAHCGTTESAIRNFPGCIPWTAEKIRLLLNNMRTAECTPQQIQRHWKTIKFMCPILELGTLPKGGDLERKKEAIRDQLVTCVQRPEKRARLPELSDIIRLEENTTSMIPVADQFASAIYRFMAGSSPRLNDIQHTLIITMNHTGKTLKFEAWQTKTTGPLIEQQQAYTFGMPTP